MVNLPCPFCFPCSFLISFRLVVVVVLGHKFTAQIIPRPRKKSPHISFPSFLAPQFVSALSVWPGLGALTVPPGRTIGTESGHTGYFSRLPLPPKKI